MREIPGRPGYYATEDGSIYSSRTLGCKPRIDGLLHRLKTIVSCGRRPYLRVSINKTKFDVHQLILEAFVGQRPDGRECRHLDGNPLNNCASNLCWGTHKENQQDRAVHGTGNQGKRNPNYRHGRYVRPR